MNKLNFELKCPKCGTSVMTEMEEDFGSYLIYPCPKCKSNVVLYDNKIDIISDTMLRKLMKKGVLKFCGKVTKKEKSSGEKINKKEISKDDLLNLRIDLESSKDIDSFLNKI